MDTCKAIITSLKLQTLTFLVRSHIRGSKTACNETVCLNTDASSRDTTSVPRKAGSMSMVPASVDVDSNVDSFRATSTFTPTTDIDDRSQSHP